MDIPKKSSVKENKFILIVQNNTDLYHVKKIYITVNEIDFMSKFILNVGVNQVVSVYGENFGSVKKPGMARDLMIAAMAEVIPVHSRKG